MKNRPQPNDDLLLSLELFCSTVCLGCGFWHVKKFMCWHTLGKHRQGERPANMIRLLNFTEALLAIILTLCRVVLVLCGFTER